MKKKASDRFAEDVASVMSMRLTALPSWWMVDPRKADRETRRMFTEKGHAFVSAQQQLMLAPMLFWMDIWRGMASGDRDGGLHRAQAAGSRRVSAPYRSRVTANRRRLARGG